MAVYVKRLNISDLAIASPVPVAEVLTQRHPGGSGLVVDPERDPGQHDDKNGR